jgi:hypothetical protein
MNIDIYIHIYMYIYMYVFIHIYINIHIYIYICIYVYIYIYIYKYMYIHTYTYIHMNFHPFFLEIFQLVYVYFIFMYSIYEFVFVCNSAETVFKYIITNILNKLWTILQQNIHWFKNDTMTLAFLLDLTLDICNSPRN